jgi:hypothetical protein
MRKIIFIFMIVFSLSGCAHGWFSRAKSGYIFDYPKQRNIRYQNPYYKNTEYLAHKGETPANGPDISPSPAPTPEPTEPEDPIDRPH